MPTETLSRQTTDKSQEKLSATEPLALPSETDFAAVLAATIENDTRLRNLPVRETSPTNRYDISFAEMPSDLEKIRNAYLRQESERLARQQWWATLESTLQRKINDEDKRKEAMVLRTAHSFNLEVAGQPTENGIMAYECGSAPEDALTDEELGYLQGILTTIDQLSSSSLLSYKGAQTLILLEGVPFDQKDPERVSRTLAYATPDITVLNISTMREYAQKKNINFKAVLGKTLAHEILGHQLENLLGKEGHFEDYFTYSSDKQEDAAHGSIHREVTPIDPARAGSKPVRKYGYTDSLEDYATAIEPVWSSINEDVRGELGKLPSAFQHDEYRAELVADFLRQAAEYSGRPAGEGPSTPISYEMNEGIGEYQARPLHELRHHRLTPHAVVEIAKQEAVAKLEKDLTGKTELRYTKDLGVW